MAKTKTDMAKKTSTAMAQMDMFAADAGMGMEGADKDSFAIPFLSVLQPLSPQLDKNDAAYVKGAEAGMIFNSVTNELFEEITVLPVAFKREIFEWVPRSKGGGLVGRFNPGQEPQHTVTEGKWKTVDDHDLVDTREHFVLRLKDDGSFERCVINMSSTQVKKSKRWMTMMNEFKYNGQSVPTFAVKYKLGSIQESNDKGKWYGWTIQNIGVLTEDEMETYMNAKEFYKAVQLGTVQVAEPTTNTESF